MEPNAPDPAARPPLRQLNASGGRELGGAASLIPRPSARRRGRWAAGMPAMGLWAPDGSIRGGQPSPALPRIAAARGAHPIATVQ